MTDDLWWGNYLAMPPGSSLSDIGLAIRNVLLKNIRRSEEALGFSLRRNRRFIIRRNVRHYDEESMRYVYRDHVGWKAQRGMK